MTYVKKDPTHSRMNLNLYQNKVIGIELNAIKIYILIM